MNLEEKQFALEEELRSRIRDLQTASFVTLDLLRSIELRYMELQEAARRVCDQWAAGNLDTDPGAILNLKDTLKL